jgi:very-short-patch-repair endonuclease
MLVNGLDGKEHKWVPKTKPKKNASKLHISAREMLKELFPMECVMEEVNLPGTKVAGTSKVLTADFYIPNYNLMIEVHGEQHYKYTPHFHSNKLSYAAALRRDRTKKEWCLVNNIKIVELPYDESAECWKRKITDNI